MSWSDRYVGIPWSEDDRGMAATHCWGLTRMVYARELGIYLDDFGPASDRAANAATIEERRKAYPWQTVQRAKPFDLVVYRVGRIIDHVGIIVERGLMLHVAKGHLSQAIEISSPAWRLRIVGLHRHVSFCQGDHV